MNSTGLVFLAISALACSPQMERACYWQCVDTDISQSADSCEPTTKRDKNCEAPPKRLAEIGEEVTVVGFDPDQSQESQAVMQVSARVQTIVGGDFVLDREGQFGLLGAGVWGLDGSLLGLVQGETQGLMWGRAVE